MTDQPARPRPPLHRTVPAAGLGAAGIALIVIGTFLPWVRSGEGLRNSYQVAGLLDRLDLVDGPAAALLAVWPFVGPVCTVPVVLAILRRWRAAGVAAIVVGLGAIAVVWTVLAVTAGRSVLGVALADTGPYTTLAGGVALAVAGVLVVIPARR